MSVHGIRRILTFNSADFAHYDIEAIYPTNYRILSCAVSAAVASSTRSRRGKLWLFFERSDYKPLLPFGK